MLRKLFCCAWFAGCANTPSPAPPAAAPAAPPAALTSLAPAGAAAPPTQREPTSAQRDSTALASDSVVVFEGMCDASGAIPIDAQRFAIADDEENSIRVYDADRGGPPLSVLPITGLAETRDEIDLEAATLPRASGNRSASLAVPTVTC